MVQGFFFQERSLLGIAFVPIDGAIAVLNQELVRDMFAGIVGQDEFSDELTGSLVDAFGHSILSNVVMTETEFSFDKQYVDRYDLIHYAFRREGDLWVGGYSNERTGEGSANCIITPIPERMFGTP